MSAWYLPTCVSGQRPVTSPMAHSRSPARICASTGIPCGSGCDADGLEADAVDAWAPAGRDQQAVATQLAAVAECQDEVLPFAPGGGRLDAEENLDAVAAQRIGECGAERRGLAAEQVLAAVHERHLAAEAMDGLSQLDADRSAAEHEQTPRDGL